MKRSAQVPMTKRLYYDDAYLREFEATVVEQADQGRRVYLDRTAFYPTSGGQPFDTGRLGGIEVTDVVDESDRIAHLLAQPLPHGPTTGQINWSRRFDHMQQHTGQHILSAVLTDLFGYSTVGVHFGQASSTLDLDTGALSPDQVARAEERANEIVVQNRPVAVSFEAEDEAVGLRKPSGRSGSLRIVTIGDLDRSACGGTHVRATGEIGAILIGKIERVRKAIRLDFVCGRRALHRAQTDFNLLSRLAAEFSSPAEDLPRLIDSQRQELKEANYARRETQALLDLCRARELYAAAAADATGIRRVVLRDSGEPLEALRGLAQAFASMPMGIFVGAVMSPPAVVLAASPDTGVDAAGVLKGLLATVGGRGGGSATVAQGIVPGRAQLETVIASIGT
jgi:alanyl-tRNA synthetase